MVDINLARLQELVPPLPKNEGMVIPFYYEPIAGSGERITAFIASKMDNGEFRVLPIIEHQTLVCMFGQRAKDVQFFIDSAIQHCEQYLSHEDSNITDYSPALSCFYPGKSSRLHVNDLNMLLTAAVQNSASLAPSHFLEPNFDSEGLVSSGGLSSRWIKRVKDNVTDIRPDAKKHFNVSLNKLHKYHFVGNHYVANLAAMNPARVNGSIQESKKMLWDLSVATDINFDLTNKELLMFIPDEQAIDYSEKQHANARNHLSMFEQEADKKNIRLIVTSSVEEAAKRLIQYA